MQHCTAIVTGHSRGLGAAIAASLLRRGIPTLALSRHGHADLARRHPGLLQEIALDLGDAAALDAWLAQQSLADRLRASTQVLLVNNAGMLEPVGPLPMQAPATVARAVGLNVAAPLMLAAAVAAATGPGQDRRILHVSSGAGRSAYAGWSVYCATKAALDQHARAVALDATPGLRICSIAPGVIDTDMQASIRATSIAAFPLRPRFDALKAQGQLASPADCAERLVAHLLDDAFGREPVADLRDLA